MRELYDSRGDRDHDVTYDAARTGYVTGYMAADHPECRDHESMDVELRDHWGWRDYDYERLHSYVRAGYDRRRSLITR